MSSRSFSTIRETQEEFGITPKDLIRFSKGAVEPETNSYPELFLCTEWDGKVKCDEEEMNYHRFLSLGKLEEYKKQLFHPFKAGLSIMLKKLYSIDAEDYYTENKDTDENNSHESEKTFDFSSICDTVSLKNFILQIKKGVGH